MEIFFQIGVMFIIAAAGAYLAKLMRQPMIPAYIIAGIVIGPLLNLITSSTVISTLSEIGIAFLLFIVGLEMNLSKLKDTGISASVIGIIQTLVVAFLGYWAAVLLGFARIEAAYIGLILAFSSTMVVIKLLSDKHEMDTLHGRLILGVLIIQDIIAIFALSFLSTMDGVLSLDVAFSIVKAFVVLVIAYLLGRYVFPRMFRLAAESQELLLLLALGTCFLFSTALYYLGFSIAIGAYIAGMSLANLPYNVEIIGRVRSLRDFFATLFFVSLGIELSFGNLSGLAIPLLVFALIAIIAKPFILLLASSIFRYTKRNSFITALSLGQVSEFSLILAAQGVLLGHLSKEMLSITIILAIITITLTSYFTKYENSLFKLLSKPLSLFDISSSYEKLQYLPNELAYEYVLVGYDRIGYSIFRTLTKANKSFLVVDFNPDIIKRLIARKIPCIYGDVGDAEILERINLKKTKVVVSTVPDLNTNIMMIRKAKKENPGSIVFTTATVISDAFAMYKEGADYVILPHFLGGEKVSNLIEDSINDIRGMHLNRLEHIDELKRRMELEHEHPKNIFH